MGRVLWVCPIWFQMEWWLGVSSLSFLGLFSQLDLLSFSFGLIVLFIRFTVFLWGRVYIRRPYKLERFFVLLFLFVIAILLLLFRGRVLFIFLGWEGLGVTSFVLIIFYQNVIRMKGGLMTLLTNRLGDAMLLIRLAYWFSSYAAMFTSGIRIIGLTLLLLTTATKRAQWPFINWLPAAMAAPTPVSALVHSSTLVTAGIWVMIRFMQISGFLLSILVVVGLVTLLVASAAALLETDAKKLVALSTLRQLGLMALAISLGGVSLCLFHVLTHAIAKANLFLVVGNVLHVRFSQQDGRKLSRGLETGLSSLAASISALSLRGFLFRSGFYSKEQVLGESLSRFSSSSRILIFILVSGLTLTYCIKLIIRVLWLTGYSVTEITIRIIKHLPIIILSLNTLIVGSYLAWTLERAYIIRTTLDSIYWGLILFSILFIRVSLFSTLIGFGLQGELISRGLTGLIILKKASNAIETSLRETHYLMTVQAFYKSRDSAVRRVVLVSWISMLRVLYNNPFQFILSYLFQLVHYQESWMFNINNYSSRYSLRTFSIS